MELVKRLSAKDILGPVTTVVREMEIGATVEAYGVAGTCSAYETGMSTFGAWNRFVGDFQGINYLNGTIFRAPKAHVPDVLESIIMEGIAENAEIDSTKSTKETKVFKLSNPIEFAFKVTVTREQDGDNGEINYKYGVKPMTEVAPNDAISHLTKLLDAPAKEEAKADTKPAKEKATA